MTIFTREDKIIGQYDEKDNVFKKSVRKSRHLLLKDDAWGIDKAALDKLKPDTKIVIVELEEERKYSISVEDFRAKGFEADYGHGAQVFCPRQHFFIKTLSYGDGRKRFLKLKNRPAFTPGLSLPSPLGEHIDIVDSNINYICSEVSENALTFARWVSQLTPGEVPGSPEAYPVSPVMARNWASEHDIGINALLGLVKELKQAQIISGGRRKTDGFMILTVDVAKLNSATPKQTARVDIHLVKDLIEQYKQVRGLDKLSGWNARNYAKESVFANRIISALLSNSAVDKYNGQWDILFKKLLEHFDWYFTQKAGFTEWSLAGVYKNIDKFISYK